MDNDITLARIKRVLTPKILVTVLLIVVLASAVFYVTAENRDKKEIQIWYVTTEIEDCFSAESLDLINAYGAERGIDRVILTRRHPEDTYFDVAMATSAYYNCDVFIMKEEMAAKYYEMDMFLPLQADKINMSEALFVDGKAVGLLINDGYYLFINSKSEIDTQTFYDILEIFKRSE